MRLFLASQGFAAIGALLARTTGVRRVAFVPTAANRLDDGAEIVAMFAEDLRGARLESVDCDVDRVAPEDVQARLATVDAIFVTGGDPFYLMARLRETGCFRPLAEAARRVPYAGVSAGAIAAGPSLEPLALESPFPRPPGMPMDALALTPHVVLPHHGRPGRKEEHARIQRTFGGRFRIVPLRDIETLVVEDGAERVVLA